MKPSESKAASQPKLNASLSKLFGQPKDLTNMTGGRPTQGDSRAAVNSNIVNNKYGESPNDYGKGV